MLIEVLKERQKTAVPLTVDEFVAVKDLLKVCCKGHTIKREKSKQVVSLGVAGDGRCYNPTTGYKYGFETGASLEALAKQNGWCGQFAGEKQWRGVGRKVMPDAVPFESSLYGKVTYLFAYEQTEAV